MKTKIFKTLYKTHTYVGLFVAFHFLILALTGSLLLFKDELTKSAPQTGISASQELIPAFVLVGKALQKYPGDRPLAAFIDDDNENLLQVRLGINQAKEFRGARKLIYDRSSGAEVGGSHQENSFFHWLLELHRELFLGSLGKIYIGLIGVLYLLVLISGFFIYGNFGRKKKFAEVRSQTPRSFSSDLHRFLGVMVMGWGLLIGLSGAFLGFSSLLIKVYQYRELKELLHTSSQAFSAGPADMQKALAAAQEKLPQARFSYLVFPDTQFSPPGNFLILMNGETASTQKLSQLVSVKADSGEAEVRKLPWYLKFSMLSEPLHFGNYGGLPLKIAWLGFSLLSLLLPILGLRIFLLRRKKKPLTEGLTVNPPRQTKGFSWPFAEKTYVLPVLFLLLTSGALLISFLNEGIWSKIFALLLFFPVIICLRVLFSLFKERR